MDVDLDSAPAMLQRALAIREQALAADHEHTASTRTNLGIVLLRLGRTDEARPVLQDALAALERRLGSDHVTSSEPLLALAQVYAAEGEDEAAEEAFPGRSPCARRHCPPVIQDSKPSSRATHSS